ncbi:hypothetical protein [Demequina pelophila]|uniref:hypothetical protein n=1 Tax=Demequina pelophila TaxID=1638984 RepID=UPI00078585CC|nr:hypothetical protein [Demequina pelophila]
MSALVVLAGCTSAGREVGASASPVASVPRVTATAGTDAPTTQAPSIAPEVSASPSPGASATAEPTSTAPAIPEPAPTATISNDPDDGVAVDLPQHTPTPTGGEDVAEVVVQLTGWGVDAGFLSASALVEAVVAEDGECTLEVAVAGTLQTATGPAERSATSSSCAADLEVRVEGHSGETATLVVRYAADGFEGASAPREVTLP